MMVAFRFAWAAVIVLAGGQALPAQTTFKYQFKPGETLHYTAADHLRALHQHAGGKLFDLIVLNNQPLSSAVRRRYAVGEAEPVVYDAAEIRAMGVQPFFAHLVGANHVARHSPRRLAQLLLNLAAAQQRAPVARTQTATS